MPKRKFKTDISEFCGLVYTQQMAEQERVLKNPDDVYEGFCDKARPMDSVPAYLAERSGISFGDACDYMVRAGRGAHWDGLKRVSGKVRSDITAIAQPVSACFQGEAMRELVAWFVDEYPHEAAEMEPPDSATSSNRTTGNKSAENRAKTIPKKWLPEALLLVRDNPEWSDNKIAGEVGIAASTLFRSPEYQRGADLARDKNGKPPKGHRTGDGAIEAYGPNQP